MSRVLELSTRDLCTTTKLSLSDAAELVRYISVHYLKGNSQPFIKAVDILAKNSKEGLFMRVGVGFVQGLFMKAVDIQA